MNFAGAAPPFAFRRLTLESAVAETVALFDTGDAQACFNCTNSAFLLMCDKHPQQADERVDCSKCKLLAEVHDVLHSHIEFL